LVDSIATALEESANDPTKILEQIIPALIGAIVGLEAQISTFRRWAAGS
jgi:hypothetical protein